VSVLEDHAREAFVPHGALSRAAQQFRPRTGQTEMAAAVARTIEAGGALVVEAGTGVGKTFSYLVPALLSGERVLLSTATKTLQDQLFGRDLPRLVEALGLPVRTALLKGRASYLCLHRLDTARSDATLPDRTAVRALAKIEQWAQATRTGDLAELPGLDERSPVIPLVTSTRENCLGSQCPKFRACHVNSARREALAADVVVINHHLFFADLAVRESGMAELLPSVRVAIFDEAHQLNETGVQFLGRQLGTGQLLDFTRDLLAAGLQQARGLVDWQDLAGRLERATRDLRLVVGRAFPGTRLRWVGAAPESVPEGEWQEALASLESAGRQAMAGLDTVSELAPDFVRLYERAEALVQRAAAFAADVEPGSVRWVDVGNQLRLVESPLDIAEAVRTKLLGADQPEKSRRSWIFTSATLGDDARLSWFTEPCGLGDAEVLKVESPFDYASQAAVYVPRVFARPNEPAHSAQVAALAAHAALRLRGGTMVLTTTLRALRAIGADLQARFEGSRELEVLVQGQWPKRRLIERFREGSANGQPGCVLVASASFWEGVDVPGDALELVMIDKLPFPPPGDPLVEARSLRLQSQGRSPFNDYFVPEAAVALKQGAGCWRRCRRCGGWEARKRSKRRWTTWLPELPPRTLRGLEAPAQVLASRVVLLQHPAGVVAQLRHAERVVRANHDEQCFFERGNVAVFGQGGLRAIDCRDVRAAREVVARHVHFVLRERVDDVRHARPRVGRVLRFGESRAELAEGLERFLGGLLVALRQVLPRKEGEGPEVVVEVDDPLEVQRIVDRGTGRVQLHEALDGGQRLRLVAGLVVRIGLLELGLLRERRAGSAPLELLEQRDRLVEGTRVQLVLGFGIELVRAPAFGAVHFRRRAAGQQQQRCQQGEHR
jgi:ATP-dependent DNA helicase DinG